jgi:acyl-CoA thioesterase-1
MEAIVDALEARKVRVLVSGMRAAPNLDPAYVREFEAIFPAVARRHGAAFDPFFLEGVAGNPPLLQPDGMHPTFAGVKHIVSRLLGPIKDALAAKR